MIGQVRVPRKCKRRKKNPDGLVFSPEGMDLHDVTWNAVHNHAAHFEGYKTPTGKWRTRVIYAHRVVMERVLGRKLVKEDVIDHLNRIGLDCRRDNLLLTTGKQNYENKSLAKNNKTGYRGVHYSKTNGKYWRYFATVRHNGKKIYGGVFKTVEEANEAAIALRKKLGFHEGTPYQTSGTAKCQL